MDKESSVEFRDFNPSEQDQMDLTKTITLWIPEEHKEKYDVLQKMSKRDFCNRLRKMILKEIDLNYSKVS